MDRLQLKFLVSLALVIACSVGLFFLTELSQWARSSEVVPQYLASTATMLPIFGGLVVIVLGWWCFNNFVKLTEASSRVGHDKNTERSESGK